jgi:hypothetical protein
VRYFFSMTSNPLIPGWGFGILFIVIYIVVCIGVLLLVLRILYSVIWRAVRRGMTEFHKNHPQAPLS